VKMLLWIVFAILTALTLFVVLAPLIRQTSQWEQSASAADIAVYRDQLNEIETDMERGLISKEEAANAKIEISRRLLHRSEAADFSQSSEQTPKDADRGNQPIETGGISKPLFYGASLFVPGFAVLLYLFIGSPNMPGLPHAARIEAPKPGAKIEVLVANVEAHLRKNPTDGKGWDVLAPVYLRQQRYKESASAYARALDLLGETPKRLSGFAMATISSNNGIVTDEARLAYERLLKLKPGRADVKYWLAVAKEQDGRIRQAANDLREMLRTARADAPWRAMVQRHLNGLEQRLGNSTAKAALPPRQGAGGSAAERGPSAGDIAAAAKMSAQDRSQMINQMVARLASRLKEQGKDLGGWRKLVRAYVVLGKPDKARQALTQARKNFGGDRAALAALDQLASKFKL
jgi:cytochrome c-type biogenesis protein CcmH